MTYIDHCRQLLRRALQACFVYAFASLRFLLVLLIAVSFASESLAETQGKELEPVPQPLGVNFTKMRDLDTRGDSVNRPVRQKWAVVAGISKFRDSRLNSEDSYDKTAKLVCKFLTDPHGGRFAADHVRLLTNEDASLQNILNSFSDHWLAKLAQPDDLVFVYIASSAFPTTDGNSYICSYNCSMDNVYGSCLSVQNLMQTIRKNIKAERIVLVLESAYSGSADLAQGAKTLASNLNVDLEKISLGKGMVILSSSQSSQRSWKDLFSVNLINALKDQDGMIPLQDAFIKARYQTEYDSVNRIYLGRKQTPVMKSQWQGKELIIGCPALEAGVPLPESATAFLGAEAHYFKANRALIGGDLELAMSEYKAALAADPDLSDARSDYAVALGMKGNWQAAELELRKTLARKPDDLLYLTNYARVLDKLGQAEACKKALEKAYAVNPLDRVVLLALADKCLESGDQSTAMRLIDQAMVLYPRVAVVQDRMCFLLSLEGRVDEAISHAREALKLDPALESARLKLGALYILKNNPNEAIREYQSVIDKNEKSADAHYLMGQALDSIKDRGAAAQYERFLQLAPATDRRRDSVEQRLKNLLLPLSQ